MVDYRKDTPLKDVIKFLFIFAALGIISALSGFAYLIYWLISNLQFV